MNEVKMMPGQEPYTDEELKRLYAVIKEVADEIEEYSEEELESRAYETDVANRRVPRTNRY